VNVIKKFNEVILNEIAFSADLVVVANIQVKILKTDEEIGFMRTAIDHGLVDPKIKSNF